MDNFSTATSGIEFPQLTQDEFYKVIEELDKIKHSEDENKLESIIITRMSIVPNNQTYMKVYNNKKYFIMREEYLDSLVQDGTITKSDPKEIYFPYMLGVPIIKNDRLLLKIWYGIEEKDIQALKPDFRNLYHLR
jgi:hypothetical protein